MTGFEVYINQVLVCKTGMEGLGIISGILNWMNRPQDNQESLEISVMGSPIENGIENLYTWHHQLLKVGDEITFKITNFNAEDITVPVIRSITDIQLSCKIPDKNS